MLARLLAAAVSPARATRLASQCAVCRSWPADVVCAPCAARFAVPVPRCRTCALVLPVALPGQLGTPADRCIACLREAPPLDAAFTALHYAYPWSTLLADYKFGDQPQWALPLARLLFDAPGVAELLAALSPSDWLVPLPLSAQRLQTRGFNQAWQLTKALATLSATRARPAADLLLRIRDTAPQTRLARAERLNNVEGAFVVDPLRVGQLRGRHVVLVDDVMTSGASIFSAARAVRQAGAVAISALVVARTDNPP